MFTTEVTMILPVVMIIIICMILMTFLIAELNLTWLSTERAFVMQVCEHMDLNGISAKKNENLKVSKLGVWTRFDISYGRQISNPFHEFMEKKYFEFEISYDLMRLNRPVVKLILIGGEKIFEIE